MLGQRALPADVQYRAFRTKRGGDAGDRISATRPRGSNHATELAGLARVTVGSMRRGLFVAHVDDANAFIETAIVNVDDMPATKREYGIHTLSFERLGNQVATGNDGAILGFCFQGISRGIGYRGLVCYSCHGHFLF